MNTKNRTVAIDGSHEEENMKKKEKGVVKAFVNADRSNDKKSLKKLKGVDIRTKELTHRRKV